MMMVEFTEIEFFENLQLLACENGDAVNLAMVSGDFWCSF
jgi:hypothetical protein